MISIIRSLCSCQMVESYALSEIIPGTPAADISIIGSQCATQITEVLHGATCRLLTRLVGGPDSSCIEYLLR